jgi:hypothetical protein
MNRVRRPRAASLCLLLLLVLAGCASSPAVPTPAPAASPQAAAPTAAATAAPAAEWAAKTPPLATKWTSQVSPDNALPEYPRPQMAREQWQNLNGVWEFAPAAEGEAPPFGKTLAGRVLVPFPIESALSGIMEHHKRMWYRRSFATPADWKGRSVQLNFGAVDWEATVYLNGKQLGAHKGGYDGFSFDISAQLQDGANELIVGVYDPTDDGGQPVGKQRLEPEGIFYTASSGIWQTVWLEPTPAAHIARLDITPDLLGQALRLVVQGAGADGQSIEAVALDGDTEVGRASGKVGEEIRIPVPNPKTWSPDSPFLYNLRVTLGDDSVTSYFGMRSIEVAKVGQYLRLLLNGSFLFQLGTLDQGFWPDGLHTAPTDEALRSDIQQHKDLGFNLIRKHIKVEPQRWYYWADKLGLLVWQDMPAMKTEAAPTDAARQQFELELREMIDEHRSVTAIVVWVPFNEAWGIYDPARIARQVKEWDPSRLVDNNSGVNCCGNVDGRNGDLVDWHVYVGPGAPLPSATRASVLGEFGGLGLGMKDHIWRPGDGFSYLNKGDAQELTKQYVQLMTTVERLMTRLGLNAAIYTQISDVETELNGLLTYDRAVLKPDAAAVKAINQQIIATSQAIKE